MAVTTSFGEGSCGARSPGLARRRRGAGRDAADGACRRGGRAAGQRRRGAGAPLLPAPAAGAAAQPTTVAGLLAHYRDLSQEAERVNEDLLSMQENLTA